MAANSNTIKRFRGDTYPLVVTLKENGTPVNLTTATVVLTIAMDPNVTVPAVKTDAAGGKVQFNFTAGMVSDAGRYEYDIQVTDGGIITTFVKDAFELIDDVTKT